MKELKCNACGSNIGFTKKDGILICKQCGTGYKDDNEKGRTYVNNGQAAAMGKGATVNGINFKQVNVTVGDNSSVAIGANITQYHSGSGDNVAGTKKSININIGNQDISLSDGHTEPSLIQRIINWLKSIKVYTKYGNIHNSEVDVDRAEYNKVSSSIVRGKHIYIKKASNSRILSSNTVIDNATNCQIKKNAGNIVVSGSNNIFV